MVRSPQAPLRVVFAVGSGFSGSTLLGLALGASGDICTLGEVRDYDIFCDDNSLCTCGAVARSCRWWGQVAAELSPGWRLGLGRCSLAEMEARALRLLQACAGACQGRWMVDSSKWVRWAQALGPKCEDVLVVHLVRDGRGVLASGLRRDEAIETVVQRWVNRNERAMAWLEGHTAPPSVRIRYEDLIASPSETIGQIRRRMGLTAPSAPITIRPADQHHLSGNPMRFAQWRGFVLDERWKQELSAAQLARFRELGAHTQERLGYALD